MHVVEPPGVRRQAADLLVLVVGVVEEPDRLLEVIDLVTEGEGVVVPARQAYSHSASVGSRYQRPVFMESHFVYCLAANWVMEIAG